MNPSRGVKNQPPEPPSSAVTASPDEQLGWDGGEEDLFDRPTMIPEVLPTEATLLASRPLPPTTPVPVVAPDDEFEWDHPSAVIQKNPSPTPNLEFDLGELGGPSADPKKNSPQAKGPGKARPISFSALPPLPGPRAPAQSPPSAVASSRPTPASSTKPSSSSSSWSSPAPKTTPGLGTPPPPTTTTKPPQNSNQNSKITIPGAAPSRGRAAASPDEVDRWGAGSVVPPSPPRARDQMPTLVEEDPLAFDLSADLTSPPRVSHTDDLGFDFEGIRNPKMREPPPSPVAPLTEAEPHTAPYPIDNLDEGRYAAGQLRQPPPVASPTSPIDAISRLDDPPRSPPPPPRRAPLMGERPGGSAPPSSPLDRALREMRDKFALGDFSGSLKAAEGILEKDTTHVEASRYADNCRSRLRGMFEAKLGSLAKVPRVILPPDQVRWLSLDHRAGFVLSCVDGYSSIEEILDVSGMASLDALRILCDLLQQKVIAVPA